MADLVQKGLASSDPEVFVAAQALRDTVDDALPWHLRSVPDD
jgi:hypothetical protein